MIAKCNSYAEAARVYEAQEDPAWGNYGYSERVERKAAELQADPAVIRDIFDSFSERDIEMLERLHVAAHISGLDDDWLSVIAEHKRIVAAEVVRRAKAHVDREDEGRRARSSESFADMLQSRRAGGAA